MTSKEVAQPEGLEEILSAWAERCRQQGADPAPCEGTEARFVLSALARAVGAETETRDLGRAARGWGDRFSSPVEALSCLSCLREVIVHSAGAPDLGWKAGWLPVSAESYNRIVDQLTTEAVDAASANLRAAARTDPLTGCANRLALNEDLERAVVSARRSRLDFSLAMIDLDGLKQINDGRGHEAGDLALVALASMLQGVLRGADRLYRIGGDEFVVMLPFTDVDGAKTMLQRAENMHGPAFSWGVASLKTLGDEALSRPELLLSTADAALYASRAQRRQAPVTAPLPNPPPRADKAAPPRRHRTPASAPFIGGLAAALLAFGTALGIVIPLGVATPGASRATRSNLHANGTLPAIIPPVSTTPSTLAPGGSHPSVPSTVQTRPRPTGSSVPSGSDLDKAASSGKLSVSGPSSRTKQVAVGASSPAAPKPSGATPRQSGGPKGTQGAPRPTGPRGKPGRPAKPGGPRAPLPGRVPPAGKKPPAKAPAPKPAPPSHVPPATRKPPATPPRSAVPPAVPGRHRGGPQAPSAPRKPPVRHHASSGHGAELVSHISDKASRAWKLRGRRGHRARHGDEWAAPYWAKAPRHVTARHDRGPFALKRHSWFGEHSWGQAGRGGGRGEGHGPGPSPGGHGHGEGHGHGHDD